MILSNEQNNEGFCSCYRCTQERGPESWRAKYGDQPFMSTFFVCAVCGNKRCPHTADHLLICTDSNEPGQTGSLYE
jgi:hypothetical protein